jgi:hypothetical protein
VEEAARSQIDAFIRLSPKGYYIEVRARLKLPRREE